MLEQSGWAQGSTDGADYCGGGEDPGGGGASGSRGTLSPSSEPTLPLILHCWCKNLPSSTLKFSASLADPWKSDPNPGVLLAWERFFVNETSA